MNVFRLATFNIRHGRGLDGRINLARTAAAILATEADVVALQELDRGRTRSGGMDQPQTLRELTALHVAFYPTMEGDDGDYGMGLVTSVPLVVHFEPLPRVGDEEPRGVMVARWNNVTIVATHLSYERAANNAHMKALARLATEAEPPTVVLGDLNRPRRNLAPLTAADFDPGPRRRTLRSSRRRQVDFVMPGRGLMLERTWTVPSDASDHLPLVAEVGPAYHPGTPPSDGGD
jgi:endonuclease/exonuclease/phosphatase family metal-dependent hydrolase